MTIAEAIALFHIKVPTTPNVLKTRYRYLSRLEHPDHSRHPQARQRFQSLSDAYTLLKADVALIEDCEGVTETETGEKLASLGNGLGLTTNGSTCGECEGKGYRVVPSLTFKECTDCRSSGLSIFSRIREARCWKCQGSGTFSRGGKIIGLCFNCKGQGWTRIGHGRECRSCNGSGIVKRMSRKLYVFCDGCKGKGELPMWNPVLPKGLLI